MIKHKNRFVLVCVAALTILASTAGNAHALTPNQVGTCLDATGKSTLDSSAIVSGLGLTRDQKLELQSRIVQYWSHGFPRLDDLDLTPEQIATITQRIKAQAAARSHPIGWPCPAFTNRSKVVAYVKAELIANAFRPRMTFYNVSPRQIQFRAIQDGIEYFGAVVKSDARQITMQLTVARPNTGGGTYTFKTPFIA